MGGDKSTGVGLLILGSIGLIGWSISVLSAPSAAAIFIVVVLLGIAVLACLWG